MTKRRTMYYFFDMDGTLCDSGEGIKKGIEIAFSMLRIPLPEQKELDAYIGPPLFESFTQRAHLSEVEAKIAEKWFRDYYMRKGKFENKLYEGMKEVLQAAKSRRHLAVATSKPEIMAKEVARKYGIADDFDMIAGANIDGTRTKKIDVIRYAMSELNLSAQDVVMIGDRYTDIDAAKALGISSIGVLYGYGTREELESCGADYLAEDTNALKELVQKL